MPVVNMRKSHREVQDKTEDMGMKVQVHGPEGKVIFLECGSDSEELMFKIMKSPLARPLAIMHNNSLTDLDKQSFPDA